MVFLLTIAFGCTSQVEKNFQQENQTSVEAKAKTETTDHEAQAFLNQLVYFTDLAGKDGAVKVEYNNKGELQFTITKKDS